MSARSLLVLLGGLVLGAGLFSACTPGSSQSSSPPDTISTEAVPEAASDSSAQRPPAKAGPTDGEPRSVSQRLADASVAARAKQALANHRLLRRFNFSPSVMRGRLTLRGDVDTREQYREAERVVSILDGVTAVTNSVTVDGRPVTKTSEAALSSDATYHTVRRGDTPSDIARRYGVSVQQLRRLNDLSASLHPGDRLRVQ